MGKFEVDYRRIMWERETSKSLVGKMLSYQSLKYMGGKHGHVTVVPKIIIMLEPTIKTQV